MKKFLNYKYITVAAFAIIFLFCDIIPPITGIFSNNYYQYYSGGLAAADEQGFIGSFSAVTPDNSYRGTMNWILRPISSVFKAIVLDIRVLSVLYFVIILLCFVTVLKTIKFKKNWQNWLFSLFTLFIFGDFAYLLRLNSPDIEGAFLVAVLAMVTISLYQLFKKASIINSIIFAFLAFFVSGLKTGYAFFGIVLMLLVFSWLFVRKDAAFRYVNIALFVVVTVASLCYFGGGVSAVMKEVDFKQSFGSASNPMVNYIAPPPIDYRIILGEYIRNPIRLIENLRDAAHNAYEIRPAYISNYPGSDIRLKQGFTLYSEIKKRFIQPDLWFALALLIGTITFSAFNMNKGVNDAFNNANAAKGNYLALIMLCVIALSAFISPVIIQGCVNLTQNMFFYNVFFDIILIYIIVGGSAYAANRREILKNKYGANQ
jgi:hypothetical protein